MRIVPTPLSGLFQIEPDVFGDARGSSSRSFGSRAMTRHPLRSHSCKTIFPGPCVARCEGSTISWAVLRES